MHRHLEKLSIFKFGLLFLMKSLDFSFFSLSLWLQSGWSKIKLSKNKLRIISTKTIFQNLSNQYYRKGKDILESVRSIHSYNPLRDNHIIWYLQLNSENYVTIYYIMDGTCPQTFFITYNTRRAYPIFKNPSCYW